MEATSSGSQTARHISSRFADPEAEPADYDVLAALSVADGGRMQVTVLAAQIGWERSRVSHHVRRMSTRGLVTCALSAADRRVTEVTLTGQGRQALGEAAPGQGPCPAPVLRGAAAPPWWGRSARRWNACTPTSSSKARPRRRSTGTRRRTDAAPPGQVLKWAQVPLPEPGEGQIRIKVKAAGISPTRIWPCGPWLPQGLAAAPRRRARLRGRRHRRRGRARCNRHVYRRRRHAPCCSARAGTPSTLSPRPGPASPTWFSWIDAAALSSSAEAAVGVLRQLNVTSGETLLLFGGGGSVGIIATQLAVARGVTVISAVGEHDETLAQELGATPVRYGAGLADRVRALGPVDAVFDAAGKGVLADAIALASGPKRVITLSDPAAADFGVTLSVPTPDRASGALDETIALLADGRLRLRAHHAADAAGRRFLSPAGRRHRPPANYPHPQLARAAQRRRVLSG